jgi:hypothetical protein
MNSTKLKLGIVGAVVAAGITASLLIQQSARIQLRAEDALLQQQADEMTELQAENERLSNRIAQAQSSPSLTTEQHHELLRLRNEVGGLRRAGMEKGQLQATNALLRAALEAPERELAAARAAPNFWAKEQLGFAGYATPETAMKTTLWAMTRGDVVSYLACFTPEIRAEVEKHLPELTQDQIAVEAKEMQESLSPAIGFHILDQQAVSATEMIVNVSFDGVGKTRKFTMRKVGDEWKLYQMGGE